MQSKVLVVDDEETIRKLLKSRLEREGWEVETATGAEEAEKALNNRFAVLITDLTMPGKDGLALMAWAKEKFQRLRVIMITGHGEKDVAIRALKLGAVDYLEKPFDLDELSLAVKRAQAEVFLENENEELLARLEARAVRAESQGDGVRPSKGWITSKDTSMAKVNEWLGVLRREALRAGVEEPTVLILGESGTGKEGVARLVHSDSNRAQGPWVAVNCANFNEQLLESELFGHEKGSFTGAVALKRGLFELAKDGTLFLDEIGEMDPKLQAKLLRVLQEKVFRRVGGTQDETTNVRVVAATHVDLKKRVADGGFREDLFHRLSRVVLELPALRERRGDIVPFAENFSKHAFAARGKVFAGFSEDARSALEDYAWPGNVRELQNVIERVALVFQGGEVVGTRLLALPKSADLRASLHVLAKPLHLPVKTPESTLGIYRDLKKRWSENFEKEYLTGMLARYHGNVSKASVESKIDRSNFLRMLRKFGINASDFRKVGSEKGKKVA